MLVINAGDDETFDVPVNPDGTATVSEALWSKLAKGNLGSDWDRAIPLAPKGDLRLLH